MADESIRLRRVDSGKSQTEHIWAAAPQEPDFTSKLPYRGAFLEPGDAKAQVDPGTKGGRGGLSQLSGVTLFSPPVMAHCEKLAQNVECSLRAPDLPQS